MLNITFKKIVAIFKINSIDFNYFVLFLYVGRLRFVVAAYQFRVRLSYLSNPPLGHDMTQGKFFLSGV